MPSSAAHPSSHATRPDTAEVPRAAVVGPLVTAVGAWFDANARDLPWRRADCSPWGVLVSEVMLQQTPVARVEPVWRAWLERWPSPTEFAAAGPDEVLRAWGRLGYPRRALRLHECAHAIVLRHGGQVPDDGGALLALPGVGEYTAAAVLAFAFGRRSVVVDTNVRRVLARTLAGTALPPPHPTAVERTLATAVAPATDADAARWAAASMELGALVCTARSPRCEECPVAAMCAWRAAGYPPDEHAGNRRAQAWHGTDRQVRGRIMGILRDAVGPVSLEVIDALDVPRAQLHRALDSLLDDGLATLDTAPDPPHLSLPGAADRTVTGGDER